MVSKKSESVALLEKRAELNGLIHKYHDKYLADDSLKDVDVLLLSISFVEAEKEKAGADYDSVRKTYVSLGRKDTSFRKTLFIAKKTKLVESYSESDDFSSTEYFISLLIGGMKKLSSL